MVDVVGKQLTEDDEARLRHPLVGGVILFARNYESPGQLAELTTAIRALRAPPLLISVDHEGGRVQRFRDGFTKIPAMRELGKIWDAHPHRARHLRSRSAMCWRRSCAHAAWTSVSRRCWMSITGRAA
jgi:beta-N-acetylhexosaminidase